LVISYLNDVNCIIVVIENNNDKKTMLNPPTQINRIRSCSFGFPIGSLFFGKLKPELKYEEYLFKNPKITYMNSMIF
jgi:hypothetical protein